MAHRLIQWYEEGADSNAKLPLLIAYLAHQDFTAKIRKVGWCPLYLAIQI